MVSDEHLLSYLTKKFDSYKEYRAKNHDQRMIDNHRLYKSYRKNKQHIWQSNLFLSYTFTVIETIMPRIINYLWQGDRLVTAHPRGREDEVNADVVDDLLQYQIDTDIDNFFLEWVETIKTYLIQGTGIGKITWDVYDDKPQYENLDVFDFFTQPFKKHVDKMDGVFHVFDLPYDVLLQRRQDGVDYKNIELIKGSSMMTKDEEANRKRDKDLGKITNYEPSRPATLIYQYWGKIPLQESIEVGTGGSFTTFKEALGEIGNRKQIIRNIDNPYAIKGLIPDGIRPFISAKNYIDLGEFWAIGDVEPYKDIQMEANEHENHIIDSIKLLISPMWKVSRQAGVDLSNLMAYPGNQIQMDDINGIDVLRGNPLPSAAFNQQERYASLIGNIAGVSDYSKGINAPGMSDTVGGITSLIEEANMRFAFKLKCLQMSSIKDLATKLFILNKIFMKGAEIPIRIEGQKGREWIQINPDNLKGMYDFKPMSIAMIGNKLAKENTYIRLLDVLKGAPPLPTLIMSILEQFELPNREETMTDMFRFWGIPDPNAPQPPQMPQIDPNTGQPMAGGMGVGGGSEVSPSQLPALPPPAINNAQVGRQNSMQMAAGMR